MVNGPQFCSNLQQPPPAPVLQTNQQTNYYPRQQQFNHSSSPQVNTLLTPPQQFNMHIPQSFNLQVPPPTFHSTHLLMGSTDSSILVALQKQWEKQERLDRECNEMERLKEKRQRMKEESEQ